jgi:hypothetical protein
MVKAMRDYPYSHAFMLLTLVVAIVLMSAGR